MTRRRKKRNPTWLRGATGRFVVQSRQRMPEAKKLAALQQVEAEQDAYLVDHESDAAARKRRKAQRTAAKAARVQRARAAARSRPKQLLTRIRELGGINLRTWPGQTARELGKGMRNVFRKRGGLPFDRMARVLAEDGYGTPERDGETYDPSWLIEAVSDAANGAEVLPASASEFVMRRELRERQQRERAHRQHDRAQRRANPKLLTMVANPSKRQPSAAAIAAFREFHETDPKAIRQIPGKGPDLIALGDLVEIVYRPTRGARRGPAFVHKFGRGAVLAATVDGQQLVLLPSPRKPFRVKWDRGIIG